jgi:hypothetical protein
MRKRTIFISHRTCDVDAAKRLADLLRRAGHYVWLDASMLEVGDDLAAAVNDGLKGAEFVVICYSPQGLGSWMGAEVWSAFARQLNVRGVRLLPVLLPNGQVPPLLAGLKYADLSKSWKIGVRELLRALQSR